MKRFKITANGKEIIIDRNFIWESCHGVKTKIVDMDDTYLANLYDFLKNRSRYIFTKDFDTKMMEVIKELQEERGLKSEFMDRAQIPYKNPNGKWEIWNHEKGRPMVLEGEPKTPLDIDKVITTMNKLLDFVRSRKK